VSLVAVFDYLSCDTQRLLLERPGTQNDGDAVQQFTQKEMALVPEIVAAPGSRFRFAEKLSAPHRLVVTAVPDGAGALEINFINDGRTRPLVSAKIDKAQSYKITLPDVNGTLEFVSHSRITWIDPRISRSFFLWPFYLALLALIGAAAWRRGAMVPSARAANWLVFAIAVAVSLALCEIILRSFALKLPRRILEVRPDAGPTPLLRRWISSSRYQMRLRPNVRTYSEWRFGDIAQIGIIRRDALPREVHRFDVESDAEGFSNPQVRDKIDIAALGDSLTEGWVVPASEAWPARLEKLSGLAVQNYGVPAFGPQQERYVLEDFALRHRPRLVVLAFFGGNDLADALSFDRWQAGRRREGAVDLGPEIVRRAKIPASFRNYEKLYLWSAMVAAVQSFGRDATQPRARATSEESGGLEQARFENGIFRIPVRGQMMSFAWMPPHLFQLATPRAELEQSLAWKLTRDTLHEINSICRQNNARLIVMYVPPAPQVDWRMTEQAMAPAALKRAIDFYFEAWNQMLARPSIGRGLGRIINRFPRFDRSAVTVDAIRGNRFALNETTADFCRGENIPLLDLTAALQQQAEAGRPVYFPDDEHWNATGHETAARELSRFLQHLP